jgi:hypothetical protein
MRQIVLLLLATVVSAVEPEERERVREQLTPALSELAEVQERLSALVGTSGITVPPGVTVTLSARRMAGEEWLKRIANPANEFSVEEVDAFREELYGLRSRLESVSSLVDQSTTAADRWPHTVETPEFLRYRGFLRTRAEQSLLEIAAGGDQAVDEEVHWRRQRRHELILQLIESGGQLKERWSLVPKDSQVLREYQDLRASLRAAAEAGLQQANPANDRELDRDENILWLLDEQLSLGQGWAERSTNREIPPDALLLPVYRVTQVAEVQALRAQIAHRRTLMDDDGAWHRQDEALRRERDQCSRLSNLVWESLEIDLTINEQRRNIDERMTEAPAAVRVAVGTRLTTLGQERTATIARLRKALETGSRVDALQAKAALRIVLRDHEIFAEEFEQRREREETEKEWRMRANEPGVADALAKLDVAWTAMDGARARQVEADHAAIRSELARELAEVEAEVAQFTAERSRQEMDQVREALELSRQRVIDVLENPQPKPEGDAKF